LPIFLMFVYKKKLDIQFLFTKKVRYSVLSTA
jgi:hypothetical protein